MPEMPAAGDPAPDLSLPDETGTIHRLSDQRGRWLVLYFYPEGPEYTSAEMPRITFG